MQHETLKEYDKEVALPRHEEVMDSVGEVKRDVVGLRSNADELRGAIKAGVKIIAIPSAILSVLGILRVILALMKGRP